MSRVAMKAIALAFPFLVTAGCGASLSDAAIPSFEDVPRDALLLSRVHNGTSAFAAVGVCDPALGACAGAFEYTMGKLRIEGNATDIEIEATWRPASPATEKVELELRLGPETIASTTGASPLSLRIEGPLVPGTYMVRLGPTFPGAAGEQTAEWRAMFQEEIAHDSTESMAEH